ncbi:MAG: hypothetical protein OES46_03255 [Gammaproteobacteria bacterium]|nr:hypothetical protein [Gammaproteobacteria bacterium]
MWLLALLLLTLPAPLLAESVMITADQWASPRSGESITRFERLNKLVQALDQSPDNQILIRYAEGETGTLWAEELRSWLVSLGIPSGRIVLNADLGQSDTIIVETSP